MRLIGTHRQARSEHAFGDGARLRADELSAGAYEVFDTRREPEAFAVPAAAADPYALWLAEREAEKDTERPEIRWVYRHERVTRPAATFEELRS
jgi:hypothetical protein